MAEEIRRRVAALRLAALLAVAVTLAGLTSRDAPRLVSGEGVPADSVGTRQVINKSLKAKDLKPGVALSPSRAVDMFLKISTATETYLSKLQAAEEYLHKIEAAEQYLKLEDAAKTYIKLGSQIDAHKLGGIVPDGFVQGAGHVESGLAVLGLEGQAELLELPGLAGAVAVAQGKEGGLVELTNTSGAPLLLSYGGKSMVVEQGGTHEILIGLNQPTLVQLVATKGDDLATLTLAATELGQGELVFTGQALVGTP